LLADNGARHVVIPGVRLGALVDVDSDGFQSPVRDPNVDGLGDNLDNLDDEDGVRLLSTTINAGGTIQFEIMAIGAGAVLNAWFDFNNDGDWDDPGEKIFNNREDMQVLDPNNPQFRVFTAQVPADIDLTATFYAARFRWGPAGIGYDGVANSGEVEDYLFLKRTDPLGPIVDGDFDGDGQVTLADRETWKLSYGSTTNLAADGNGDGVVDSADYTVWRDAFEASLSGPPPVVASSQSTEEAPVDPAAVPALITMPIVEDALEAAVYDANAFAPMFLTSPKIASVLDESLAIEDDGAGSGAADSGNAIDAALLQWALGSAADDEQAPSVYSPEEAEQDEVEEFEEAFASAFAF
jgi:hypothetical protein